MALMKSKVVPQDAVVLDEMEAAKYVWDIISEWEPASDTWALHYSSVILSGINAFSGVLINRHYRFKLRLGTYGYFASVLPLSLMPALLTGLFHRHLVTTDMLLMKREGCPVCYEVRSGAIQVLMGTAYPVVLAPATGMMLAHRYATYRVPDLREGPKAVYQFVKKISRTFTGTLTFLVAGQLVASSVLTYFELRNNFTFRRKMMEIESKLEAEQGGQN